MTIQFHGKHLPDDALDQIFREARTYNGWLDKPVSDDQLHAVWDLIKMAPTSANMLPARIVWVKSDEGKAKLVEAASDGNKDKIKAAPVTAIIGMDLDFHEQLPWLFPHADAKSWFEGDEDGREEAAMRNSSMQGGYFIIAARALGLDCGPMSGFNADAVNDAFFADHPSFGPRVKVNFICSVGYGDPESIFDRSPRPEFGKFNSIV